MIVPWAHIHQNFSRVSFSASSQSVPGVLNPGEVPEADPNNSRCQLIHELEMEPATPQVPLPGDWDRTHIIR